jgi:hypothetical protein
MNSINPLLVASPTTRSGTTLLQRLLCSASNTLIYGEFCANELFMATQLYLLKQQQLSMGQGYRKEQLEQVLSGQVNHWIPDLMPDPKEWLKVIGESNFRQFEYMKDYALQHNRPVWGMKMAGWNPHSLHQIMGLFPETRLIYLIRNAEDCLRSAKAMDMVGEGNEEQFLQSWNYNHQTIRQIIPSERVLYVQYEDLVKTSSSVIEKLESFSGAKGIDVEVMSHKINNDGSYMKAIL